MKEASRADHNLHRLVGHANLLDHLMLDLASAEEEQEAAYNNSYTVPARAPAPAPQSKQHIIWADTVVEEEREEDDVYDAGSDNEETSQVFDDDEEEDLTLTRTPSHSVPGLSHEDESEDDSEPESEELEDEREIPLDAYSEKQRQAITTTSFFSQRRSTLASKTAVSLLEEESWRQIAVAAC